MKKRAIVAGHICVDITPAITGKKCNKLTDINRSYSINYILIYLHCITINMVMRILVLSR